MEKNIEVRLTLYKDIQNIIQRHLHLNILRGVCYLTTPESHAIRNYVYLYNRRINITEHIDYLSFSLVRFIRIPLKTYHMICKLLIKRLLYKNNSNDAINAIILDFVNVRATIYQKVYIYLWTKWRKLLGFWNF
jgi:hypothetical protein